MVPKDVVCVTVKEYWVKEEWLIEVRCVDSAVTVTRLDVYTSGEKTCKFQVQGLLSTCAHVVAQNQGYMRMPSHNICGYRQYIRTHSIRRNAHARYR